MSHKVRVEGIQKSLDAFYAHENSIRGTLDSIREELMRRFEEDDKRRGVPYLQPTKVVSDDFIIQYTEAVSFVDGEVEATDSVLDSISWDDDGDESEGHESLDSLGFDFVEGSGEAGETGGVGKTGVYGATEEAEKSEEADFSTNEPLPTQTDAPPVPVDAPRPTRITVPPQLSKKFARVPEDSFGFDDWPKYIKMRKAALRRKRAMEVASKSPSKKPDPPVIEKIPVATPIKAVAPKPEPTRDISDLIPDVSPEPVSPKKKVDARPAPISTTGPDTYRSLRDLVKHNPGCSVAFAARHFPKSEIQKNITLGRVYLRNGKLGI